MNALFVNALFVGVSKDIELPRGGFLLIDDEVWGIPKSRVFDLLKHSFDPLRGIDYKKARAPADVTISPQGKNKLTVRNGKRALLKALLASERLDELKAPDEDEEVAGIIADLLASPVLRQVLCNLTDFSFRPDSKSQARINRAELGEFDALVLGLYRTF
jgi:hypothetical protein